MRRALFPLAVITAVLAVLALQAPRAVAGTDGTGAAQEPVGRVIVKYREHAPTMRALSVRPVAERRAQLAATLGRRWGLSLSDGHAIGERAQLVIGHGISSAALAARLAADSEVEYAEPDLRRFIRSVPNDPFYADNQATVTPTVGQWYLRPPTSTTVSAVNAQGAWSTTRGTSTVVVAVLDTGVRFDHPDLIGKLLPGYDFVSDTVTANDGDGRDPNPSDPGDWVTTSDVRTAAFSTCSPGGSSWHGTQVSGIIGAATENAYGMASVAPNVMVLPVRVLGKCGGYDSDIQAAMLWAAGLSDTPVRNPHPAKVLNLSLGGQGTCTAGYKDTLKRLTDAGVTVVVSAGNDAGFAVDTPANCEGAIAVAGLRHAGTKVGFSSIGPEVAISAPAGNCVNMDGACLYPLLTADNFGSTTPGANGFSDGTRASYGTSFSAPLVAGTAALMLSVNPQLAPAQIKSAIQASARPFPTSGAGTGVVACQAPTSKKQEECYCTVDTCGAGMLDTGAAVGAVASATAPVVPLSVSTANPSLGAVVELDASEAVVKSGRTIAFYAWSIVSGEGLAQFTSAMNAPAASVQALASGWVTVMVTVTDSAGESTSSRTMLAISGPPTAAITPTSAQLSVGTTSKLSAASSAGVGGRVIAQYQWEVTHGEALLTLIGGGTGASVTLQGRAPGNAVVKVTVTDDAGQSASTEVPVTVTAAPPSSSGGGGALGWGWLMALAAAVVATRRTVGGRAG
jgi:serine protease